MLKEYIKSDGKIYEVVGRDGQGRPVTMLTKLKELPEDKPLIHKPTFTEVVETEEAPKRRRTRKK